MSSPKNFRLTAGPLPRAAISPGSSTQAHPLAAAARGRLQHDGEAERRGRPTAPSLLSQTAPGTMGTPAAAMAARADSLFPMARIALAAGPMKTSPARSHASGSSRVLAEKAIAGVDGVAARGPRGLHDAIDTEVALGRGRRANAGRPRRRGGRAARRDRLRNRPPRRRCPSRAACARCGRRSRLDSRRELFERRAPSGLARHGTRLAVTRATHDRIVSDERRLSFDFAPRGRDPRTKSRAR